MQFAHPQLLWLFLVMIPLIAWYIVKQRNAYPAMAISTTAPFKGSGRSVRAAMRHSVFALILISIGAMIVALARPQTHDRWRTTSVYGTDIVLALDVSSSMLARDFKPDRLEAAKEVAIQFINGRENDNMGVVIFAGESLTGMPLTSDRGSLTNYVKSLSQQMLEDGTAIGDGLATAINRIKAGKAVSKSIILLTDGSNNTGIVTPLTAADIARQKGIKVYTIGVGTNGMAYSPTIDAFGRIKYVPTQVVIDEGTLKQIASMTGGKYFRATDNRTLQSIFSEIDSLEKTVLDSRQFSHTEDDYMIWALIAAAALIAAIGLRQTVFRTIP